MLNRANISGIDIFNDHSDDRIDLRTLCFFLSPADIAFTTKGIFKNLGIENSIQDGLGSACEKIIDNFFRKPEEFQAFIIQNLQEFSKEVRYEHLSGIIEILKKDKRSKTYTRVGLKELLKVVFISDKEKEIFQKDGPVENQKIHEVYDTLIKKSGGYLRKRDPQVFFSENVNEAFNNKKNIIIEAPTGTGKTVGYLIPAIMHSYYKKDPVFISTFTKTLQIQAYKKEIKLLHDILPPFKVAVLFGRENYPCALKLEYLHERRDLFTGIDSNVVSFGIISQYLDSTLRESMPLFIFPGNISKGDFEDVLNEVISKKEDCRKKKCRYFSQCPYFCAVKKIKYSNIAIVNHWNLLANIVEGDFKNIDCIIDETDKIEIAAVSVFSDEINSYYIMKILKNITYSKRGGVKTLEDLILASKSIASTDGLHFSKELRKHVNKLKKTIMTDIKKDKNDLEIDLYDDKNKELYPDIYVFIEKLIKEIKDIIHHINTFKEEFEQRISEHEYLEIKFLNVAEDLEYLKNTLARSLSKANIDEETEFAAVFSNNEKGWALLIQPITAGELLKKFVYPNINSMVMTSATISVDNSPDYFINLTALEDFNWILLPEYFDLRTQMKIFVIDDIPQYNFKERTAFRDASLEALEKMIMEFRGKLMILFTSYADMYYMYNNITKLDGVDYLLQKHGVWDKEYINEIFRTNDNAVLFGVKSYWYGIDFPGDILKYLIIFKLPYLPPMDYIVKRRGEYINDYMNNEAKLAFKQAIGRLIRTENDKGCVYIFDNRIYFRDNYENFFSQLDSGIKIKRLNIEEAIRETNEFLD